MRKLTLVLALLSCSNALAMFFGGIGIKIRQDPGPQFVISEVFANGPAEQAGVFVGEEIKGVDGSTVSRKTLQEVANMIQGAAGSDVVLALRHASYPNLRVVKVKRVELPPANL